jgi:hypothetical protein
VVRDEKPAIYAIDGVADPVNDAIDRVGVLSATPSTAPISVNGIADRFRFGSMA